MYVADIPLYAKKKLSRPEWFTDFSMFDRVKIVKLPKFWRRLSRNKFVAIAIGHKICYIMPERYDPYTPEGIAILAHELKHVAQYEKIGMGRFLVRYIIEFAKYGYRNISFEKEARRLHERVFTKLLEEKKQWVRNLSIYLSRN